MDTGKESNTALHISECRESYTKRIVAITVGFPGASKPLIHGEKMGLWDTVMLGNGRVVIPDADVYLFGAYHPIYGRLIAELTGKKGMLWTSSIGEMDFEPIEQEYLRSLLADTRIDFIWFGDKGLAGAYQTEGFYAPYPLVVEDKRDLSVEKKDIVTLFCPTGNKKNILNQLIAVKLAQREKDFVLHTNIDNSYDEYLKDIKCVRHPWVPQKEYEDLIRSAKLNLAVSWAETFNYQVAECLMLGTLSVISNTIPLPGVRVDYPNDAVDIKETMLLELESDIMSPVDSMLWNLTKLAEHNMVETRRSIDRLLSVV